MSYTYYINQKGKGRVVFLHIVMEEWVDETRCIFETISEEYSFVTVVVDSWNDDLSPWPFSDKRQKNFGGKGREFLTWIETEIVDKLKLELPCGQEAIFVLGGYSLAGLFSLWACMESRSFAGCISCSGSLWYPGFEEYVMQKITDSSQKIYADGQTPLEVVYLSLGIKEEKTKDKDMCRVGESTRGVYNLLLENNYVNPNNIILEMNPGNHFADTTERCIKGYRYVQNIM